MTADHPAPKTPIYAVGDLHGRADLLSRMLALIDADSAAQAGDAAAVTVFLGDHVDRGENARGVLELLCARQRARPGQTICLMGNHERMMLDALDRPGTRGERWLTHGGLETMASYGLGLPDLFDPAEIIAALRAALPDGQETWLRGLPLLYRSGDVVCVHAALDPALPPGEQTPRTMLWAPPPRRARRDGLWVVHGHTVVDAPGIAGRRVAVDTGAWFSDCLTAAAIYPGVPIRFLRTGS